MASRVWKWLGRTKNGLLDIAYRLDAEPLCVDCEQELANEIAGVLVTTAIEGGKTFETVRQYEGRTITWSAGPAGYVVLPGDMLPVLEAGICMAEHPTRQ